jgi:hypothetical protein
MFRNRSTPALALLCAVCLLPLLLPATASAKIVVSIYGSGGLNVIPPEVCPDSSSAVCATIEFDEYNPLNVVITHESEIYDGVLNEAIPVGTTEYQGCNLDIESMTAR